MRCRPRLGGATGLVGVKWTAHRPPLDDGAPPIVSVTLVNDAATGLPVGIVESAQLTAVRTAAVSALALQLAPAHLCGRVTLLGAGVQAAAHLRMLAAVLPGLEEVTVWNRTPGRVPAMLDAVAAPWPVMAASDLAQALAHADAVVCCTAATAPILGVDSRPAGADGGAGRLSRGQLRRDRPHRHRPGGSVGRVPADQRQKPVPDAPGRPVRGRPGRGRPAGAGAGRLASAGRRLGFISPASA